MAVSIDRQMERLRARKADLQRELAQLEKVEAELERTIELALRTIGAATGGAVRGAREAARAERSKPSRSAAPRKRPAGKTRASGNGKRGRPKGSGKRQGEAIRIITANPGIRTAEVARKMGMKNSNYLYRLLPDLAANGAIAKDGKGWIPTDGNSSAAAKAAPRKARSTTRKAKVKAKA